MLTKWDLFNPNSGYDRLVLYDEKKSATKSPMLDKLRFTLTTEGNMPALYKDNRGRLWMRFKTKSKFNGKCYDCFHQIKIDVDGAISLPGSTLYVHAKQQGGNGLDYADALIAEE